MFFSNPVRTGDVTFRENSGHNARMVSSENNSKYYEKQRRIVAVYIQIKLNASGKSEQYVYK